MRERKYDDAGFTSKERLRERQGLATKELLIELRSLLDSEQSKDSEFRSRYYREALNYLNRFWKEIFTYLDDGELRLSGNFWLVSFKISYLCLPLFYETRTTPSCHPSGCAYRQL